MPASWWACLTLCNIFYNVFHIFIQFNASVCTQLCQLTLLRDSQEQDLSLLNDFYKRKKAWPDHILKIRQTIYKKRHAQGIEGSQFQKKTGEMMLLRAWMQCEDKPTEIPCFLFHLLLPWAQFLCRRKRRHLLLILTLTRTLIIKPRRSYRS